MTLKPEGTVEIKLDSGTEGRGKGRRREGRRVLRVGKIMGFG